MPYRDTVVNCYYAVKGDPMRKMIVIDDEYLVRLGIRETIDWQQHDIEIVGEAPDGRQGLQLALQHRPDVIICDIRMPVMDGVELVRQVRDKGLDCAIVILSGYKDFDHAKDTLENGAYAYLLKPIDNDELINTVIGALDDLETRRRVLARAEHLTAVLPAIGEKLLHDLIIGDLSNIGQLRQIAAEHQLPISDRGRIVLCRVDDDEPPLDADGTQAISTKLLKSLQTIIQTLLNESKLTALSSFFESSLVLLVDDRLSADEVESLCNKAVEHFERVHADRSVTIGISGPYDDLLDVRQAFAQAKEAASEKLFPHLSAVLVYGGTRSPFKPQIVGAMQYIARHYGENVTVKAVADHLYVSESTLMHLFRDQVGMTFNECLTAYRMMIAKKMLRSGKYRIYEIADHVGYKDPKYFSQTFRKIVGVSPSQFGVVEP